MNVGRVQRVTALQGAWLGKVGRWNVYVVEETYGYYSNKGRTSEKISIA